MKCTQKTRSFFKGLGELKCKYAEAFKVDFMAAFNISTRVSWCNHKAGRVRHTQAEEIAIESLFAKYGVEKEDVWD